MIETWDVILRLLAATVAGAAIGLNRDLHNTPIGMRTLALVALGTAIVAVATIRVEGMLGHPDALSRVVQGIIQGLMAGVGFIGAGVILRDHSSGTVYGLTTAATVWLAAAFGVACGVADWSVVGAGAVLAFIILVAMKWIERRLGLGDENKQPSLPGADRTSLNRRP
jgi:putative Mg2+ transporter-C (MgtC) family protein